MSDVFVCYAYVCMLAIFMFAWLPGLLMFGRFACVGLRHTFADFLRFCLFASLVFACHDCDDCVGSPSLR